MPALNKLTSLKVKNAAPGKYSDGGGLWLHKRPDGGAQWFLRYTLQGKRREMGLGSLDVVSLRSARDASEKWRSALRDGLDPIRERDRARREAARPDNALAECTDAPHEVAETILGHVAGSKVVNTYRRTDYLEQRRALLERWAEHVTGKSGEVLHMVKA